MLGQKMDISFLMRWKRFFVIFLVSVSIFEMAWKKASNTMETKICKRNKTFLVRIRPLMLTLLVNFEGVSAPSLKSQTLQLRILNISYEEIISLAEDDFFLSHRGNSIIIGLSEHQPKIPNHRGSCS